ncbi:GNAT family N-acetyltransferase [Paraburkholderia sp. J12]|uniref:GNAT family N-acetyltransferase n=1 Tax=Paraburkholderia sp. J12 TaxID=2805432 RepID=UPI002ABDD93B|nr:GNAT family N-acetyltransferase [Paraburkholderia sp. J12]
MTTIRALAAADADRFKALRLLAIETSPTAVWPTREEEASRSIDEVAARIRTTSNQSVFGAFAGEALVGIAGVRREPFAQVRHKATIWGVFVDPSHRRKGIAQDLLAAAAGHADEQWGSAQLMLCVNAENAAAKGLYASLGFRTFGVEPRAICVDGRFYDEEHMCKPLR